jgi:hypothetical protein
MFTNAFKRIKSFLARSKNCEERQLALLFMFDCMPVCPSALNESALIKRIFMKFDIWALFENLTENFKFH